jgi:hypothetical protein
VAPIDGSWLELSLQQFLAEKITQNFFNGQKPVFARAREHKNGCHSYNFDFFEILTIFLKVFLDALCSK